MNISIADVQWILSEKIKCSECSRAEAKVQARGQMSLHETFFVANNMLAISMI